MGKLVQIKTKPTGSNIEDFINGVAGEQKRNDSFVLLKMMTKLTKEKPKMWGTSIIGFGDYRFKSAATGREVDWFRIGFSPRKANLSLYLTVDIKAYNDLLQKLGKHKTGAGCLYINKLEDVNMNILEAIIKAALKQEKNPGR